MAAFSMTDTVTSMWLAATASPSPTPSLPGAASAQKDLEWVQISPGLPGFLATFGVVAATIVLMIFMTRQIRRIDHNHRRAQAAAAAEAGSAARPEPPTAPTESAR